MTDYTPSPFLVPFDGAFSVPDAPTAPAAPDDKKALKKALKAHNKAIQELQRRLYADDRWSILLIFQAMDAAGKDGTIRAVLSGVNPAGCQVFSFKKPSAEELDSEVANSILQISGQPTFQTLLLTLRNQCEEPISPEASA